ncbi:MAG TPA: hypothetical protein VGN39_13325, partial [Terriglobales bacterium]|nr:hypothetical protein [Terriglobales bacterium]
MPEWLFRWDITSVVVPACVGIAFAVLAFDDFKLSKVFFLIAAADASGGALMWGIKTENRSWQTLLVIFAVVGSIGVLTVLCFWYVNGKENQKKQSDGGNVVGQPSLPPSQPSLVFVFGAPLGDNESASWIMMLKHYGPNTAYNCDVVFYDNDRKNIEHEWLVKHPNSPFPPPGLAGGESQKQIHISELSPEAAPEKFVWNPLNPNSQHYTVSIG